MTELRTPEIFSHERLGHMLAGIGGIYSHVTPAMRQELMDGLTERWTDALDVRLAMNRRSPVAILDDLMREHHENAGERTDGLDIRRISAGSKSRFTAKRPQPTGAR
ncbi:hypothetical protein [Jiangella asiatica]|uniref:hypothetical protein n=1 Tax=Jiangella asiatica TaxID=2530372 RepID=UPI00193D49DD|nr:hypothetical protein [Jiangella asiatica]